MDRTDSIQPQRLCRDDRALLDVDAGLTKSAKAGTRRAELARVIDKSGLLLSLVLPGSAADIVRTIQAMGLEGVIAKRKDSPYEAGERSGNWQKLKLERQQEFVVGGYRPDGSSGLDALLVGYYEDGDLHFAAKELVVQIQFVEWTAEGRLRHAKFLGLRVDKPAKDVRREM